MSPSKRNLLLKRKSELGGSLVMKQRTMSLDMLDEDNFDEEPEEFEEKVKRSCR